MNELNPLGQKPNPNEEIECAICFENINLQIEKTAKKVLLTCGHQSLFHRTCLEEWFKRQINCPYARCKTEYQPDSQTEKIQGLGDKIASIGKDFIEAFKSCNPLYYMPRLTSLIICTQTPTLSQVNLLIEHED